jgi:hypothetical protein
MYEHLQNIPEIMDHNRACIVSDCISYLSNSSNRLELMPFLRKLPNDVIRGIYDKKPGLLMFLALHKGKYLSVTIRDRPINAYTVMIDQMPYVYFENELFEVGPALSFQQVNLSLQLEALFIKMKREGQGTTWGQEELIINALGAKRMPYIYPTKEVSTPLPKVEMTLLDFEYKPSPLAKDTEMLETPRIDPNFEVKHKDRNWKHSASCCPEAFGRGVVREDITQSEEYKAMLASRGKR